MDSQDSDFNECVRRIFRAQGLDTNFYDALVGEAPTSETKPRLRVVTDANAGEFSQAPKRRGRRPKVQLGGNIMAFARPLRADWPAGWSDWSENVFQASRQIGVEWLRDGLALPQATRNDRAQFLPLLNQLKARGLQ